MTLALVALLQALSPFDEAMESFLKKSGAPGGSLAVAKDGRLVYAKAYGLADPERKDPVEVRDVFRIASISKPFTAVAVLQLVDAGKLDLDVKAFGLLGLKPGPKGDARLADITVRQLLHHTGGWDREKSGDPMFKPFEIAKDLQVACPPLPDAIIRWMLDRPLDFEPGARYAYSNFGYCVLGRVIEKVTGESYSGRVESSVLKPLGITDMRIGKTVGKRAGEVAYTQPELLPAVSVFNPEERVPWPYGGFHLEALDAHGGWTASAVDLVRFASSLEKLLQPGTIERMFGRPPGLKPGASYYALGWMVRPVGKEGKANVWHGGSLPGTNTLLVRRHDGLTWAVLFNQRSKHDAEIDAALHKAADAVTEWPKDDLFPKYR